MTERPPISFHDLEILARTIWGEARGEPQDGQAAVAHVALNRWRSGKWFGEPTIAMTCLKPRQFSCWNPGDRGYDALMAAGPLAPDMAECLLAALAAITGVSADPTEGATHYHRDDVHPAWAKGHEPAVQIGRHLFYRGIA